MLLAIVLAILAAAAPFLRPHLQNA